ncbi:hypothetical protein C8R45DRAFT_1087579 [Mycena sanguinolenta]|nr:hypothetical protein C8R45DRAFT_1087579 [Mycena sanguinolenta]
MSYSIVNLHSVLNWSSDDTFDDVVEIAWYPNEEVSSDLRWDSFGDEWSSCELMSDGWTRLKSTDIVDTTAHVGFSAYNNKFWFSQANYIFAALQISSGLEDYVVTDNIYFDLAIFTTEADTPMGFLFLCPPEHFRTGEGSLKWPDCPAYCSFDPSGVERLTLKEATNLGFPSFQLSTRLWGVSWDASVYAGLHQFHEAKGFDPGSQDVARHLGHELYQLSGPFAHVDDEDSDKADDGNEDPRDEELDNVLESTLMDYDKVYSDIVDSSRTDCVGPSFALIPICARASPPLQRPRFPQRGRDHDPGRMSCQLEERGCGRGADVERAIFRSGMLVREDASSKARATRDVHQRRRCSTPIASASPLNSSERIQIRHPHQRTTDSLIALRWTGARRRRFGAEA